MEPSSIGGGTGGGVGMPLIISAPDLTGSEHSRRERTALYEDGCAVGASEDMRARLKEMAKAASSAPDACFKLAASEKAEPLVRLIHSGDALSQAISGRVDPTLELDLTSVRGALDRRLERAVLTPAQVDTALPSVISALRWVRLGRIGRVRLLELIGGNDAGTDLDPLGGFELVSGDGVAELLLAMIRLSLAWVMAWPPHSGEVQLFVARLSEYLATKRREGVPWSALSPYLRSLWLKVDSGARRFASREDHIASRTPPVLIWIDGPYEYVKTLEHATVRALITRSQRESEAAAAESAASAAAILATGGDLEAAKAAAKEAKSEAKRKRKAAAKAEREAGEKSSRTALPPPAPDPATSPVPAVAPPGPTAIVPFVPGATPASVTAAAIRADVDAKHPPIRGRKACAFFFGPKGSCAFDAATCTNGHHGQ